MQRRLFMVLMLASALFCTSQAMAGVWYVDGGVGSSGDGMSWGTAFQTIQEGIDAASATDDIWVKMGTYTLSAQIDVNEQVGLYGGFAGTETAREERDWEAKVTKIDGNLVTRCLSVTTADGVIIDGFTITQGRSTAQGAGLQNNVSTTANTTIQNCIFDDNDTTLQGGAIDSRMGNITVLNCTFKNNDATTTQPRGGAIFVYAGTAQLENCSFENNAAGSGGALYFRGTTGSISLTNCHFTGNMAYLTPLSSDGGAILSDRTMTITGCTFVQNSAIRYGGVIASYCPSGNSITFTNCLFANNSAGPNEGGNTPGGGAIAINSGSDGSVGTLNITNCSFSGNSANGTGATGGAIYNRALYVWTQFDITNSILWGDSPDEIYIPSGGGAPTVSYSDVQGGYAGTGNIDLDPLFVTGIGGGYYLSQIASGQGSDSPCVDTGDPATVQSGTTRTDQELDTGVVDMGYHYTQICTDEDGDGYAVEGDACGAIDCDDTDPQVNPDGTEVCGQATCSDTKDNDCDGTADAGDSDCTAWCSQQAQASTMGMDASGSNPLNLLAILALPMAAIVLWRGLRRKN